MSPEVKNTDGEKEEVSKECLEENQNVWCMLSLQALIQLVQVGTVLDQVWKYEVCWITVSSQSISTVKCYFDFFHVEFCFSKLVNALTLIVKRSDLLSFVCEVIVKYIFSRFST